MSKSESPVTINELARLVNERQRYVDAVSIAERSVFNIESELVKAKNSLDNSRLSLASSEKKIMELVKLLGQ